VRRQSPLTAGIAHAAPVGREALPKEHDDFVKKFGYEPFAIKVATGSLGSLGKTATTIVLVAKDNPDLLKNYRSDAKSA